MAVPNVASNVAFELYDDAGDHTGVGTQGVFRLRWARVEWRRRCNAVGFRSGRGNIERTAGENLKTHQMEMDGVGSHP